MNIFRDVALAAWDAGLSPLPVRQDGSKRPFGARSARTGQPSGAWKRRQRRRCSRKALERVFRRACITGLGIVTGAVSGHLRLLEFDCRSTYQMFLAGADSTGFADLVARVRAGYEEESPGGGIHWLVRARGGRQ